MKRLTEKRPPENDGSDFRLKFVTADGSLVMNRKAERDFYITPFWNTRWDTKFIEAVLVRESREKGCRVISYEVTDTGINCLVEWL